MTQRASSFGKAPAQAAPWRELRSPPAANDTRAGSIPLSRRLPKDPREIALLNATLDLTQASDLRAAAMLVMLGLGLRKHELVALDVADVVAVGAVVCVAVKSRARETRGQQTFLPLTGSAARTLRRYLAQQHDEGAALTSPLFYCIEHGRVDRLERTSANSISYWLLELRLRARAARPGA
jgi:site-specific recombinase XerD